MRDDPDRETFVRTLAEASERSGFRVHAFVLMTNRYHLLLETPQANLSREWDGCRTPSRAASTRGTAFGGISLEAAPQSGAGGDCSGEGGHQILCLEQFASLSCAVGRRGWKRAAGFEVCGCADTASGRREFLSLLERRVDWRRPRLAGTTFAESDGKPELAVYSNLRRGWFFGSEKFREKLLRMVPSGPRELRRPMATTGRNSTTTQRNGRAASFGRRSNTLGRILQRCGGHAREIGAKGCLRP